MPRLSKQFASSGAIEHSSGPTAASRWTEISRILFGLNRLLMHCAIVMHKSGRRLGRDGLIAILFLEDKFVKNVN